MLILDAHLSPGLAPWIVSNFDLECSSTQFLNHRHSPDNDIFFRARALNAIVITKDEDFVKLLDRYGSPTKVIWLTCGNTSKMRLKEILSAKLKDALKLLHTSDLVEITGY
ncbi:DUF5615 family PIN-like protein [Dyadobacter crusticola]|uniref:DUF5615 family PIN-like protein n=1 Tax=Dyadobacter crusticola TaxID=292407 RepID=UPI001969E028|nr:DUF5615 family PIN-like protein [Dyadobacter crusticola]